MQTYENTAVFIPPSRQIVDELDEFGKDGWMTVSVQKIGKAKGQSAGWRAFFVREVGQED